jgi:hypothetical protein
VLCRPTCDDGKAGTSAEALKALRQRSSTGVAPPTIYTDTPEYYTPDDGPIEQHVVHIDFGARQLPVPCLYQSYGFAVPPLPTASALTAFFPVTPSSAVIKPLYSPLPTLNTTPPFGAFPVALLSFHTMPT